MKHPKVAFNWSRRLLAWAPGSCSSLKHEPSKIIIGADLGKEGVVAAEGVVLLAAEHAVDHHQEQDNYVGN